MTLVRTTQHGAAVLIKLDDPKRRNILSPALCRDLSAAVAEANANPDAKAIVITGVAPAFCAGADLDDLQAAAEGETEALHAVYQSFMDLANSALPTIAAVNGVAVGAGMNLALACDIRLASEDASFDTRFLKIGLHPGGGHGWMLLRAIGWAETTRLLLLGQPVKAVEAKEIGLVQRVVAPDQLIDAALKLANRTEALPRELIVATKASLRVAAGSDHQATFAHETDEQMTSLHAAPFKELVRRLRVSIASR
jgi:enoyl-CoA hydratase